MNIYQTLFTAILFISSLFSSAQYNNALFGEIRSDTLRIVYFPETIPEGTIGFKLKYQKNEIWTALHEGIIHLSTKKDKNLDYLLNDEQSTKLKKVINADLNSGRLKELSQAMIFDMIKDKQQQNIVKIFLFKDFPTIQYSGFGLKTSNIPKIEKIGLFAVNKKDNSEQPIAELASTSIFETRYHLNNSIKSTHEGVNILLDWSIDIGEYESWKVLNGFNIYKVDSLSDTLKINQTVVWMKRDGEKGHVFHREKKYSADRFPQFFIRPVSLFGTEGEAIVWFADNRTESYNQYPVLKINQLGNSINLAFHSEYRGAITLERKTGIGGEWESLFTSASSNNSFQDHPELSDGALLFYRIKQKVPTGFIYSELHSTRLKASLTATPRIRLESIAPKALAIPITIEYGAYDKAGFEGFQILFRDSTDNTWYQDSGIGLINDLSVQLPQKNTPTQIAIRAVHASGKSTLSNILTLPALEKRLTEVPIVEIQKTEQSLNLRWIYATDKLSETGEFVVLLNGVETNRFPADKRRCTIDTNNLPETEETLVNIIAMENGISSPMGKGVLIIK